MITKQKQFAPTLPFSITFVYLGHQNTKSLKNLKVHMHILQPKNLITLNSRYA